MKKEIIYAEQNVTLACDEKCKKAFGRQVRPKSKKGKFLLADSEVGKAPKDPGTSEGNDYKPITDDEKGNKWCARQCERSVKCKVGEAIVLPDFTKRVAL